ncbi:AMP-binding protein [Tardibacter chloracetimidivorans]|uniref:AMP-binding protein n=1 Tax=Tardibacter chloracetimidivorans TaxID=1921510 RepID=A0A1L4A037_9SPHN|nr:AMP-binding protein [Tardibacter chloracetimidivorans]
MPQYADAVAAFDLSAVQAILFAPSTGSMNPAEICCDRHAGDPSRIALRCRNLSGEVSELSFADLKYHSERLARLLASLGVTKGDRVAGLLPRTPELLITILATWRLGGVYQPLFTAFGPKAIEHRLSEGATKVVVTNGEQRGKVAQHLVVSVVCVGGSMPGDYDFWGDVEADDTIDEPVSCTEDDPFLIMFTSGTTGAAKPLLVPLRAIAAFVRYMVDAVDLRPDDRFWNLADPGWAYGLYYAVIGPLALGLTTTFDERPFSVESTIATIRELGITNLAGSPSAYRLLMGTGTEAARALRGQLRAVSSAGEPLNAEIIRWFADAVDTPIFDHYGQTETGMVLCNHHGLDHPVHVGSAGFASPGHRVVILSDDGQELGTGVPGVLALDRTRSPLMWFTGYLGRPTKAFSGNYYLTGDICELNEDGSISFVGRSDDVITTSGYRVGPFDVESALLEHAAVLESAVIGKPDPERTEIIKAFVVLQEGYDPSTDLAEAMRLHVKVRLSAHAYPREIEFVPSLPKTPSGKLQRFLLRNAEIAKAEQAA